MMERNAWLRKALIVWVFSVLSLITTSLKAAPAPTHVVDMTHALAETTRQDVNSRLLQAANEGRADIIVLIVNQATSMPHKQLTNDLILEWEAKLGPAKLPKKRAYLVLNKATHQGDIVLGKDVVLNDDLLYSLREIQIKILAPSLIAADMKTAVVLASQGLVGVFEVWPAHVAVSSLPLPLFSLLKWAAQCSLLVGIFLLLRALFKQPHWQTLPISEEAAFLLNQQASLDMAYWREHRHIESI